MGLRPVQRDAAATADGAIPSRTVPSLPASVPQSPAKPVDLIYDDVLSQIEPAVALRLPRPELTARVEQLVAEIADNRRLLLNREEQGHLAAAMVDDMIALGPLEPLLRDDSISDILVNGPRQI